MFHASARLKDLLERPLMLDQEVSYLEWLRSLVVKKLHFVIRLNLSAHPPPFTDVESQELLLTVSSGNTVIHNRAGDKG